MGKKTEPNHGSMDLEWFGYFLEKIGTTKKTRTEPKPSTKHGSVPVSAKNRTELNHAQPFTHNASILLIFSYIFLLDEYIEKCTLC